MSITTITPQKLSDLIHSGTAVDLIDVRTPVEYREVHVSCARNVPLDKLNAVQLAAGRSGSEPLSVSVGRAVVPNRRARSSSPPVTRML